MINKDLNTKIEKAIAEDLPKQVGEVLQSELKELEVLRKQSEKDKAEIKKLKEHNNELLSTISSHKQLDKRAKELKSRENVLESKQRNLDLNILEIKLEEANKRADVVTQFTSGLVRNTEVRKSYFSNRSWDDVRNDSSGYPIMNTLTDNNSGGETTTEE